MATLHITVLTLVIRLQLHLGHYLLCQRASIKKHQMHLFLAALVRQSFSLCAGRKSTVELSAAYEEWRCRHYIYFYCTKGQGRDGKGQTAFRTEATLLYSYQNNCIIPF